MRPAIDELFARYGTALSAGDLLGIGSCFDPPSVVIADDATVLMIDQAQVKEFFTGMAERYRARGAFTTTPTIRRVEQLTPALWLADVRWDSFDETGAPAPVGVETYRYLMRATHPHEPLIVAAIVTR
jgi:hypothetical protein